MMVKQQTTHTNRKNHSLNLLINSHSIQNMYLQPILEEVQLLDFQVIPNHLNTLSNNSSRTLINNRTNFSKIRDSLHRVLMAYLTILYLLELQTKKKFLLHQNQNQLEFLNHLLLHLEMISIFLMSIIILSLAKLLLNNLHIAVDFLI